MRAVNVIATAAPTLLDEVMPSFDHRTVQGRPVQAPVGAVAQAVRETRLDDALLARVLLGVRTLGRSLRSPGGTIAELGDGAGRFLQVADSPFEIVVGFVGRPWPGGAEGPSVADAAAFRSFVPDDSVKVAMSVRCAAADYGTLLVTETRIVTGPESAKPFGRYWLFARPGSDLVRRSLLRAIAKRAEQVA